MKKQLMYQRLISSLFLLLGGVACVPASQAGSSQAGSKNLQSTGTLYLRPTVYYTPLFDKTQKVCAAAQSKSFTDGKGRILAQVCAKDYDNCALQGSCFVKDDKGLKLLNAINKVGGVTRFAEIDIQKCPYGVGVQMTCLDPYYSVAADLRFHKLGDVIFLPAVRGVKLPNGSTHSGYFIVRDRGGGIKGSDRFDFYTGMHHFQDGSNAFSSLGLSDKRKKIAYNKITDKKLISEIRSFRGYPGLPRAMSSEPENKNTEKSEFSRGSDAEEVSSESLDSESTVVNATEEDSDGFVN